MVNVLFVIPEIRLDGKPLHFPFWAGILGAIIEQKGGNVAVLDLNALRMDFDGNELSEEIILAEISRNDWDLIGIGGLTTTYKRIKELSSIIKKASPNSILVGGGGFATYNPDEILKLIPEMDLICMGEGEETFAELYDQIEKKTNDFSSVNGLCLRTNDGFEFTAPRALIPDLNTIPFPNYDLFESDIYFRYSPIAFSLESINSKKRASVVWERGCPRGCTFCSHNGMSRIDLQNIYGKGDRKKGEKLVRASDKENNTFQLPARWPTPRYAVDNIKLLKEKFNVDFISILDENMTSNKKWTMEFCKLYKEEGLDKTVKWGTLGDAPSIATFPELVKIMKDAGCCYISCGFESASDKVQKEDIGKGQNNTHLVKTIYAMKEAGLTPISTFMIGNFHENIDDLMETVYFWMEHGIECDPFICTPYVGSPIYYNNKTFILQQYDERLRLVKGKEDQYRDEIAKWELEALDKFMGECGNATDYTATVSQYFTIPELMAIKQFMHKKEVSRLLQMAHRRFEETGLPQWDHDEKWSKFCNVCTSKKALLPKLNQ
ncbi:MAG: B12-binding domain-containing radical SAM protein [Candidatus Nitrosopelagicus sp.]|jgi:anaerobic magnesium-protoporphyrin IX monomethyl ester cyclase|nr:B12-binding domain-containing radical SAM protein [Candidatus Nitrosopelagicus sp.]